jgi:PAS domain S-box-containing protein
VAQPPPAKLPPAAEYYEQIFDSLSSGVIAFDKEGSVVLVNRAARQHLGVNDKGLHKGMRIDDLLALGPFVEALQGVLASHEPVGRTEVVLTQPDGGKKEIGFSASMIQGPGDFNGAVFLFVDMTERRNLERAAELNRQLAQIGELTAGVVHELRNPLSVISGMGELLQRKMEGEDPRHKYIDAILQETRNLERLVSQFLGFAKPFELDLGLCAPQGIIDRVIDLCQPHAQGRPVRLESRVAPDLPDIQADGPKLVQALVNIVNNAIDAVADDGLVALIARREQGDIVFEILDNGPGIHLKPGEDLFKPFFSKKEGGTGLGLAIAHRIVTSHSGFITYGDRPEGGAWFQVRVAIRKGALR